MRSQARLACLLGVLPLLVASCAPAQPVALDTVRPIPVKQAARGFLTVYTATEEVGTEGPVYFSGYRVYSSDGSLLRNVYANGSVDLSSREPRAIVLPAGKYLVEARTADKAIVRVPVVIEDGRQTVVDTQQKHD
jgi:hypothetical protein